MSRAFFFVISLSQVKVFKNIVIFWLPSINKNNQGNIFEERDPLEYSHCPIGPFTILELRDQDIGEFYKVREDPVTALEAPKLRKGRSGIARSLRLQF